MSITEFKFNLSSEYFCKEKSKVVLSERKFPLNQSKSKFVTVNLSYDLNFTPCIEIVGNKGDRVIFTENEWNQFMTHQGVITNYFYSSDVLEAIEDDRFTIDFTHFTNGRVVKITKDYSSVYLGFETVCKLWELQPLIEYRVDILKRQHYGQYFQILKNGLSKLSGDVLQNALDLLQPEVNPNSENISLTLEFIHLYPEVFRAEFSDKP